MNYDVGRFDVSQEVQPTTPSGTYWEAPDGTTIDLHDPISYWILWGSPTGWTGHTGSPETLELPDFSATQLSSTKYQRRTPSVTIAVAGLSRPDLENKCDALISALSQERGLGRLHIVTATGDRVYIDCIVASGYPEIALQSDTLAFAKISLIAPDPRYYGEELITVGANGTTNNPGNAQSPCLFTCSANTVSNTAHSNTISNATGYALSGVIIDTTPGHLRATKNAANAMHYISMASDIAAFTVYPGSNTFAGISSLTYRPAWRGRAI